MSKYILANLGQTTNIDNQLQKSLIDAQKVTKVVNDSTKTTKVQTGLGWAIIRRTGIYMAQII